MTSASEIFSNWFRSRSASRNSNPHHHLHVEVEPTHLHGHSRRRRHPIFEAERELLQLGHSSTNTTETINNSNDETVHSRLYIRTDQANDRLPGAVLQARARLLERLHGISVTGNRENITSSGIFRDAYVDNLDFRITYPDDWENEALREWSQSDGETEDSNQAFAYMHNISTKKPPGLGSETICSLPQDLFKDPQGTDDVVKASLECCICLERFLEGDKLFWLHCDHRFHPTCLEPWLRTCGDCPYCRARISA